MAQRIWLLPQPDIVETSSEAELLIPSIQRCTEIALDTETNGLDRHASRIDCWSAAWIDPSVSTYPHIRRAILSVDVLPLFVSVFRDPAVTKIFHNAPFDLCMFWNSGISFQGRVIDTALCDAMLDCNRSGMHGLKECAWDHFGLRMRSFKEAFGGVPLNTLSLEQKSDYASEDAWATLLLWKHKYEPEMKADVLGMRKDRAYTMQQLYDEYYSDLTYLVFEMCAYGWYTDVNYLSGLEPAAQGACDRVEFAFNKILAQICREDGIDLLGYTWQRGVKNITTQQVFPGGVVKLGSREQLAYLFTDVLGYNVAKWTAGGTSGKRQPSMDDEALHQYVTERRCPLSKLVLEYRKYQKLLSTYIRGLIKHTDEFSRVHASLRIHGARTGRMSCTEPNLQNLPRPANDVLQLRKALSAPHGKVLIVADYSILEMRVAAALSQCKNLVDAINSGRDIHCENTARMFQLNYDELIWAKKNAHSLNLTETERLRVQYLIRKRTEGKTLGFGVIYQMGPAALSQDLGISVEEAEELIARFFQAYPGVYAFIQNTIALCKVRTPVPYVQTWLGRKRYFLSINSKDKIAAAGDERSAGNTPIQGTAADIVNIAMLCCKKNDRLRELGATLIMQVHDELVFDIDERGVEEAMSIVKYCMEQPFANQFAVPIIAEVGYGKTWADAK